MKTPHSTRGGAKSGALGARSKVSAGNPQPAGDPGLTEVVQSWPTLPVVAKAGNLAVVRTATAAQATETTYFSREDTPRVIELAAKLAHPRRRTTEHRNWRSAVYHPC
jgi:hypothetical protein